MSLRQGLHDGHCCTSSQPLVGGCAAQIGDCPQCAEPLFWLIRRWSRTDARLPASVTYVYVNGWLTEGREGWHTDGGLADGRCEGIEGGDCWSYRL